MKINIIAVGKIKEKYLKDAISEYSKRLSRFCNLSIIEIPDFPDTDYSVKKEAELISKKISGVCVPLCIEGKQISSEELASFINKTTISGNSEISFIIGGSNGLDNEIKKQGNLLLSFSKMTFPHQLARLMLIEQIYRAFKINNNETYHK